MKLEFFLFVKKHLSLISEYIQFLKLSEKSCQTEGLLTLRDRIKTHLSVISTLVDLVVQMVTTTVFEDSCK